MHLRNQVIVAVLYLLVARFSSSTFIIPVVSLFVYLLRDLTHIELLNLLGDLICFHLINLIGPDSWLAFFIQLFVFVRTLDLLFRVGLRHDG
jgi:hypothetical protein